MRYHFPSLVLARMEPGAVGSPPGALEAPAVNGSLS